MLAGATLDPERLLWAPGRKLISIPRPRPPFITVPLRLQYIDGTLYRMPVDFYRDAFALLYPPIR